MTSSAPGFTNDLPATFGARLTEERERLGMDIHELAHLAGITDYQQKRFENGTSIIPIDYLQAISANSEIDFIYLITGVGTRQSDR